MYSGKRSRKLYICISHKCDFSERKGIMNGIGKAAGRQLKYRTRGIVTIINNHDINKCKSSIIILSL